MSIVNACTIQGSDLDPSRNSSLVSRLSLFWAQRKKETGRWRKRGGGQVIYIFWMNSWRFYTANQKKVLKQIMNMQATTTIKHRCDDPWGWLGVTHIKNQSHSAPQTVHSDLKYSYLQWSWLKSTRTMPSVTLPTKMQVHHASLKSTCTM